MTHMFFDLLSGASLAAYAIFDLHVSEELIKGVLVILGFIYVGTLLQRFCSYVRRKDMEEKEKCYQKSVEKKLDELIKKYDEHIKAKK